MLLRHLKLEKVMAFIYSKPVDWPKCFYQLLFLSQMGRKNKEFLGAIRFLIRKNNSILTCFSEFDLGIPPTPPQSLGKLTGIRISQTIRSLSQKVHELCFGSGRWSVFAFFENRKAEMLKEFKSKDLGF